MLASDDLEAAGRHMGQLRRCVESMQANLDDTIEVQRLKDYVTRLGADLNLLAPAAGIGHAPAQPGQIVFLTDEDYDPAWWADAESEHLGALSGGLSR